MSLIKNTAWSAVGSVINVVGRMLITIILARMLGPENFGSYVFVLWIVEINFLVFSVGLVGTATRFFPQTLNKDAQEYQAFSLWFIINASAALLFTSVFSVVSVNHFSSVSVSDSLLPILAFAVSSSAYALMGARAQGLFQFRSLALSVGLFSVVSLAALGLSGVDTGVNQVFLIMSAAYAVAAISLVAECRNCRGQKKAPELTSEQKRHIAIYAKNAWISSLGGSLLWARGELPLIRGYMGETAVGLYSIGLTISGLINQLLSLLTGALWPQIASLWDRNRKEDLAELFQIVTSLLLLVAGFAVGFLICFSDYIVALLFGAEYVSDSNLVSILAIGALGLTSGFGNLLLQASTNGRFPRNLTIFGIISLFTCAFFLMREYGLEGAAFARSFTQISMATIIFICVRRLFTGESSSYKTLRGFIYLVILSVSLSIIEKNMGDQGFSWQVLLFLIYLVSCYCAVSSTGNRVVSNSVDILRKIGAS